MNYKIQIIIIVNFFESLMYFMGCGLRFVTEEGGKNWSKIA